MEGRASATAHLPQRWGKSWVDFQPSRLPIDFPTIEKRFVLQIPCLNYDLHPAS